MTVLITLTTAGTDSGPFDLYSNLDGFVTPFETNILKTVLEAGYTTNLVPDFTQVVRVQSKEKCVNFIDIVLDNTTTTTTSTSSTTTTTTTKAPDLCILYEASTISDFDQTIKYLDCVTGLENEIIFGGTGSLEKTEFCALENSLSFGGEVFVEAIGNCITTTTTTTTDFPWLLLQTGDPIQQQNTNFIKIQ